jgi:hypothetical protein
MPEQIDRTVTIAPDRLAPWLDGFRGRHGELEATSDGETVRLLAADGAAALISVPFPPLDSLGTVLDVLKEHVARPRRVGAILIRKGGFAVGVFSGARLTVSKVGSSYVQGKTKAGGWSQQRYARRRDNQSRKAYDQAADEAVRVLLPHLDSLQAVATGGDKPAVTAVLADPRLAGLRPLALPQVHPVADPRLRVLQAFPEQFLAVTIGLNELA